MTTRTEEDYVALAAKYADILDTPWGFEVGPGWYDIIATLICEIAATCPAPNFSIVQVKEKFGHLRVYTRHGNEAIYSLIDKAEEAAKITCETCGAPGTTTVFKGWYQTVCEDCDRNRRNG